ncbi:hypothetical protein OG588_26725 [Streptomyces prunicolor]|uniref:hypothetical protein n=1 Tax=Streptomyces prunicolor TaxID=67348 RepID=UPI0038631059|nr:hypothetical protein OG588_26725 [Streptomyces prunicolor]
MTRTAVHATLTEEIARAVEDLPGVAFLKPGLTGLLRSALPRSDRSTAATASAGVRVSRPSGAEPWRVEISLVALRHVRGVDVARAARRTVEERVAALFPAETMPAQVSVTVTGLV